MPTALVSARNRASILRVVRPLGLEQQLSISFRLGPRGYRAYVLGRDGADFTCDDLAVAGQIQRAIIGLDRHTTVLRQLRAQRVLVDLDAKLTPRKLSVLGLLAAGHSTEAIGHRLQCSPRTIHKHLEHVYRKLGVRDRVNALRIARLGGLA